MFVTTDIDLVVVCVGLCFALVGLLMTLISEHVLLPDAMPKFCSFLFLSGHALIVIAMLIFVGHSSVKLLSALFAA
jgi:hypothetical protein